MTFAYADGSVAQLTSVWHQVLIARVEPPARGVLREGAAVDRRRLPRARCFVQTDDGDRDHRGRCCPSGSDRLTVPEVFAKALAQYAEPTKAFLDALAAGGAAAGRATRRPRRRSPRTGSSTRPTGRRRGGVRSRSPRARDSGPLGPPALLGPRPAAREWRSCRSPTKSRRSSTRSRPSSTRPIRARRAGLAHHAVPAFGAGDPVGGARLARRPGAARLHLRVEHLGRRARLRGDARVLARHRAQRPQARQGTGWRAHRRLARAAAGSAASSAIAAASGATASAATTPDAPVGYTAAQAARLVGLHGLAAPLLVADRSGRRRSARRRVRVS